MKRVYLAALCVAAAGCAFSRSVVIDGKTVPRVTNEYEGLRYKLRHELAHPRPGGPSSGVKAYGGVILGNLCGNPNATVEVDHKGDHIAVGTLDGTDVGTVTVRERDGAHVIQGRIAIRGQVDPVELRFDRDHLDGRINIFEYSLTRKGDALVGVVRLAVRPEETANVELRNYDAFWNMPAVVQAMLLPDLLLCGFTVLYFTGNPGSEPFILRFGPPYEPSPP